MEVYSINTSSWRTAAPLNHSRGDLVLGVLGTAVFAVGGELGVISGVAILLVFVMVMVIVVLYRA